ncbi:uncharacterized protein LOC114352813 [Ostrinia furnacalis]|uniref:uncharacterized protein LOC114352813 n=1 Tax=Ostrinia furnacalis TaxID=93504 RepID=UPI001038D703|nr:uncharacterized protein LOC114352813 [Ostrinia furnacalis]
MYVKKSLVVLCTVLVFSSAAFVDNIPKCSIKDSDCQRQSLQYVIREASKTGIPEVQIAPFDPLELQQGIDIPIQDIVQLHFSDGVVKGLGKCLVNDFVTKIEQGQASLDITCNITVKGHYKANSSSPVIKSLLGGESVHGDGRAKVKIEKLNLKFDFNFYVEKRDGETYFKRKGEKVNYKYDVLGQVQFAADHLYLGERDASELLTNMLNQNWRLVMQSVGNNIMKGAMGTVEKFLRNFYDNIPTKYYITEDLSQYASN